MDQLAEENTSLRCRLRDVAHSPLSDTEKHQLLLDHRQQSSSAPASIATSVTTPSGGIVSNLQNRYVGIYHLMIIVSDAFVHFGGEHSC